MRTAVDPDLVVLPDLDALAREAAHHLEALAREAVESRGRFTVALSGGSTPAVLYRLLAEEPYRSHIPWAQVHLFWADERCVPPDDPASNYRLAHDTLIAHIPIPADNVHRIHGELSPSTAARAYDRDLRRFFRGPQPLFDLVLLGLGRDGHTASLFPGSQALQETDRLAVATTAFYDDRPAERVTLTLPALNAARHVLFIVSGPDKADILQAVLADVEGLLPARRIRPAAGQLTWLLDTPAAANLHPPHPSWPPRGLVV